MSNLYTKTGDKGETSLYGGSRISKDALRVECYGTIDEANSMLGLAYCKNNNSFIRGHIRKIQKKLFSVGAELASDSDGNERLNGKVNDDDVRYLEYIVDECTKTTGKQTHFVIPGKDEASAALHAARTIVRRAERRIIALNREENMRPELMKYVNRLSDALYALARLQETYVEMEEVKNQAIKIVSEKMKSINKDNIENEKEFNLDSIKLMAEYAEEKAEEMNVPVVFSAVDEGGNIILIHRMKGSLLGSIDVSINKAYTANAFKMPTHKLGEAAKPDGSLYGIQETNKGRIVIFGGGYPYEYKNKVAGAIGVSGGTVEEDMEIASYALEIFRKGR